MMSKTNCFIICIAMTLFLIAPSQLVAIQDNEVKDAFAKGYYPWYDKEADSVDLETEIPLGGEAKTKDRKKVKAAKNSQTQTNNNNSDTTWLAYIIWVLVIVFFVTLLLGVLIWFLTTMGKSQRLELASGRSDGNRVQFGAERIERLPFAVSNKTGDFYQAANQAYQAGDYSTAITYLYSHILLTLDRSGTVRLQRGKTNRNYLREVVQSRLANQSDEFEDTMILFEAAFFGGHEISKQQYENCLSRWNELERKLMQNDGVAYA